MKRKASLVLLELLIMLLVFSLAAALCVRAFSWADSRSRQSQSEDMALQQVQNAAEILKHSHGDYEAAARRYGGCWNGMWCISYDENWEITSEAPAYRLQAEPVDTATALMGKARLTVWNTAGTVLARLEVCWQEVEP